MSSPLGPGDSRMTCDSLFEDQLTPCQLGETAGTIDADTSMPHDNHFRHQQYSDGPPRSTYQLIAADEPLDPGCDAFRERMADVGDRLRQAGIGMVLVVHGTFVGQDVGSVWAELGRWAPAMRDIISRRNKAWINAVVGDKGNYTGRYVELFERGINRPGEPQISVELFDWSGENHHVGRADGAIRLLDRLQKIDSDQRVLLWGHSHAGNVFALVTNLIAAPADVRDAFFKAARIAFRSPIHCGIDVPVWQDVWDRLSDQQQLASLNDRLDIVTFGTPIRYGWDTGGYGNLLHVVHHRPAENCQEFLATFPPSRVGLLDAAQGDVVQQFGIAGTNVAPGVFFWRTLLADRRLNRFLQPGLPATQLRARLALGMRVPDEGHTLLVDYGPMGGSIVEHHAGHAVYTLPRWLAFHSGLVAEHLYPPERT